MIEYRDINGNSISPEEWGKLIENIEERIIGRDEVNGILVSTVFVGFPQLRWTDQGFLFDGYFETMLFNKDGSTTHSWRYETLEEAQDNHLKIVEELKLESSHD